MRPSREPGGRFWNAALEGSRRQPSVGRRRFVLAFLSALARHPTGRRIAASVALNRRLSWRELGLAFVGLAIVAGLALGPHIQQGGFYLDDWSNGAAAIRPPGPMNLGTAIANFGFLMYRPVQVLYVPLTFFAFGMHPSLHLLWTAFLALLVAGVFYGVLRRLGVPWIHAWLISALTIVFPWSDSLKMWAAVNVETLAILFLFSGVAAALIGLDRRDRRWHGLAALLYLLSILTYEVTLPAVVCAGVIYVALAGWREARPRWLIDLAVAAAAGIWDGAHTVREISSLSGDLKHLGQIIQAGGTIAGRAVLALGATRTALALSILGSALVCGLVVYRFAPRRFAAAGWGLRNWLLLMAAGIALSALGWAMFIPANPYYTPTVYGEVNRVNGLAAFGLILLVYSGCGVIGSLIGGAASGRRIRSGGVATGVTLLLGLAIFGSYTHVLRRHIQIWDQAWAAEKNGLGEIEREFPNLPPHTTLFASGYPANQTLGVPIMTAMWDLKGMVEMGYGDLSLNAYPVLEGRHLVCGSQRISLTGPYGTEARGRYGSTRMLDLATGARAAPANRDECRRVAGRYVPGPLYLSASY